MPTTSRGRNLSTTVTFWNQAICLAPTRLMAAGIHRPVRAMPKLVQAEGLVMLNSDST
jgi:hypothetical protein